FLRYEPELFIGDITQTHVALLNKFNVIDHHLLIVTRAFEDQEALLSSGDFEALWMCMAEFEALGFYNGGTVAGASQPHKHLQMVPLPLADEGPSIPIEPLLGPRKPAQMVSTIAALPFMHAFTWLSPSRVHKPLEAANASLARYLALLDAVGISGVRTDGLQRQSAPYNLLVTRRWMLLVPRSQEFFDSISVNALGFAGSLFVRDSAQLRAIKVRGPMTALQEVALAASGH
ncbi:MAG: DUF4922 domain-containing protein, partial [Acidiferrobacterales bacterium]